MKLSFALVMSLATLALAGCASYRGAAYDETNVGYGAETQPGPMNSPVVRPGMNPRDIRDPASVTQPAPTPPNTP